MGNIHISGSGRVAADGSVYDEVRISGSGRISGTLRCGSIGISGSGHFEDDVVCDGATKMSGSGHFGGDLDSNSIRISGAGKFAHDVRCDRMSVSGAVNVGGNVDGNDITLSGAARVKGNVSAENIRISGVATIDGLLNAEHIEIRLGGINRINEIGCAKLEVGTDGINAARGFHFSLFGMHFGTGGCSTLDTNIIEGDELILCDTKAKVVRGKTVRIGPGCEIERVEYTDWLEVDGASEVGQQIRL